MKVYKMKLIKNDKIYFINQKQKEVIEAAIKDGSGGMFSVGGDQVRVNSIDWIQKADMDINDLPSYYKNDDSLKEQSLRYRNLPTTTVLLSDDMKIENKDRDSLEKSDKVYLVATAHFVPSDNGPEMLLDKNKIKELVRMVPQSGGYPHAVANIWRYGEKRM